MTDKHTAKQAASSKALPTEDPVSAGWLFPGGPGLGGRFEADLKKKKYSLVTLMMLPTVTSMPFQTFVKHISIGTFLQAQRDSASHSVGPEVGNI